MTLGDCVFIYLRKGAVNVRYPISGRSFDVQNAVWNMAVSLGIMSLGKVIQAVSFDPLRIKSTDRVCGVLFNKAEEMSKQSERKLPDSK